MNNNVAIIAVNNTQIKFLKVLEKLHIIKVLGCDDMKFTLSDRILGKMVYISSAQSIMLWLHKKFNSGFLVSKDGTDRRDFEAIVTFINKNLEAMDNGES